MNISFHKPCKLSRMQLWELVKCAFVSCMIACSLFDGRSVRIECFMHLPTVIFMSFSQCAVCKMTVTFALFEKNMTPNAHKHPEYWVPSWLERLLTSFLIIFLLNIYLFVIKKKKKRYLKWKFVYFTRLLFIHFQMISNKMTSALYLPSVTLLSMISVSDVKKTIWFYHYFTDFRLWEPLN